MYLVCTRLNDRCVVCCQSLDLELGRGILALLLKLHLLLELLLLPDGSSLLGLLHLQLYGWHGASLRVSFTARAADVLKE